MQGKKMRLRSCSHLHYIQAVRHGQVSKVANVSHGRPALVFKTIKEIYELQDAERIDPPSRICSSEKFNASQFDPNLVKEEELERPVRTDQWPSDCNSSSNVNGGGCDLDDFTLENMTIKQIKKRCRMNKRKLSTSLADGGNEGAGSDAKVSHSNSQIGLDDYDLEEPLINLKSKLRKNIKGGKEKCGKKHVTAASQNALVVVKTEQEWFDDSSFEADWDLPMPLAIRVEVPEDYNEVYGMTELGPLVYEQAPLYRLCARDDLQEAAFEGIEEDQWESTFSEAESTADTLGIRDCSRDLDSEPREEGCIVNGGIHLDSNDRSSLSDGEPIRIHNNSPRHVALAYAEMPETSSTTSHIDDSTSNCNANPSANSAVCSVSTADFSSENDDKVHQVSGHADEAKTSFQHIPSPDAGPEHVTSESIENNSSLNLQHVSRRLLSKRKVISPTSQEWLRKAMRSNELSDVELFKCRGKLYFRNQRDEKVRDAEMTDREKGGDLNGKLKKQKNNATGSPPKVIQKMRQSAAPRISVECNSTRSSSESAIAFSQRQMQDIENLATKLLDELKYVKEIAEEASHSGALSNTQSKYGPDEVRTRIENATRVEETAKRWLSMMSRDCSRFCKIMRLTENGRPGLQTVNNRPAPQTAAQKERKISFADEVGKELCYVKYI